MAIADRTQVGQPVPAAPNMPVTYPKPPEKLVRAFPEAADFFRAQEQLYRSTRIAITNAQQDLATPITETKQKTIQLKWDGTYFGKISAEQIEVDKLSAITAEIGNLSIGLGGSISQGQTAFDTGIGFWLGDVGGVAKFSIGDPANNYLKWDGTSLKMRTDELNLGGAIVKSDSYGFRVRVDDTILTGKMAYEAGKIVFYPVGVFDEMTIEKTTGVTVNKLKAKESFKVGDTGTSLANVKVLGKTLTGTLGLTSVSGAVDLWPEMGKPADFVCPIVSDPSIGAWAVANPTLNTTLQVGFKVYCPGGLPASVTVKVLAIWFG